MTATRANALQAKNRRISLAAFRFKSATAHTKHVTLIPREIPPFSSILASLRQKRLEAKRVTRDAVPWRHGQPAGPAHKPPPVPTCAARVFASHTAQRAPPFLLPLARSGCSLAHCSARTPCSAMAPQRTTAAPAAPATGNATAVSAGCARESLLCARQLGRARPRRDPPASPVLAASAWRGLRCTLTHFRLVILAARPALAPLRRRTRAASARGVAFARCLPT